VSPHEAAGRGLPASGVEPISAPSPQTGFTPLPPGSRVFHYEIVEEIGRGGMGVVYRARDTVLGREVALKTPLLGRDSGARLRKRFLREARAASSLSHPGIVPVFEAFEEDGALLALWEHGSTGDIWVLETTSGRF